MESSKKDRHIFFKQWIIPIITAFIVAICINKFLIFNVYIPSSSMVPTINVGDKLMIRN